MNRYPLWKYAIIVVALLMGGLYTLPNFFGEAPAVQVSAAKAIYKVDVALQTKVAQALKDAAIEPTGLSLEGSSLRCVWPTPKPSSRPKTRSKKPWCPILSKPRMWWR